MYDITAFLIIETYKTREQKVQKYFLSIIAHRLSEINNFSIEITRLVKLTID